MNASTPSTWDAAALSDRWAALLDELTATNQLGLPARRIRIQAEADRNFATMLERWPQLSGPERALAWSDLEQEARKAVVVPLPACVRCGDCCQRSSPTLHPDDFDLVRGQKIPWGMLVTLRRGEPVRSPLRPEPFALQEEQIKIREKPGSHECALYDAAEQACTVYFHRPVQCRAQACWDPRDALELIEGPRLTRRMLFDEVSALLEVIEAHESRCSFDSLRESCAELAQTARGNTDKLIEVIAFEDHVREEICRQLNIPTDAADLLFGRSFVDLVPLLGLAVERNADGTRTLVPRHS